MQEKTEGRIGVCVVEAGSLATVIVSRQIIVTYDYLSLLMVTYRRVVISLNYCPPADLQ